MTSNKFVMDAFAWLEYFEGSASGEKVRKLIEDPDNLIITNIVTLAELSSVFSRRGRGADFSEVRAIICSASKVFRIDEEFAQEAGILHALKRKTYPNIGLVDSMVMLTALQEQARIVTGDRHFSKEPGVVMIC